MVGPMLQANAAVASVVETDIRPKGFLPQEGHPLTASDRKIDAHQ